MRRDPLARELGDRGVDAGRGNREEHEIRSVKLVVAAAERTHLEPVGEPNPGEVALVLARLGQTLRLLRGAAQQGRP